MSALSDLALLSVYPDGRRTLLDGYFTDRVPSLARIQGVEADISLGCRIGIESRGYILAECRLSRANDPKNG